jgi:HEAT repeat protein
MHETSQARILRALAHDVVYRAARALGVIGAKEAIPPLEEWLDGYTYNPHSDDPNIGGDLRWALEAIRAR